MANRDIHRTVLLQTLFEWDLRGKDNQMIPTYSTYIAESFNELSSEDTEGITEFLLELVKKQVVIDDIIEKAAPSWPLEKISVTDRNVLRIGLFELLFGDRNQVPPKVAINEAIELAKRFGGPKSGKFVNGIIGAVYKEIGEPGKDDMPKTNMNDVPYEEMPIERKVSAVVYSVDDQEVVRIGMVHDIFGYWTLSKGGIEDNESPEDGVIREIKEETNWDIEVIKLLGDNEYIAYPPKKGPTRKQVTYFLAKSPYVAPTLESDSGGLDDVRWFELSEITDLRIYDDVSKMLIESISYISEHEGISESLGATAPNLSQPDLASMERKQLEALARERGLEEFEELSDDDLQTELLK